MENRTRYRYGLCGLICLSIFSIESFSAGFYLSEVGTPGSLGTGGVANPVNNSGADSSWTNPAGMTGLDQDQLMSGMTLIVPQIEFESSIAGKGGDNGGNAGNIAPVPGSFYVRKLSEKLRFGFSVTAPIGGGLEFGDNFVGRYGATKVLLMGVGISSSIGYKVNDKLSIGAGLSIVYTRLDEDIAINQGPLPDGKVELDKLEDFGFQPFFGLTYEINDRTLLGLVYRAEAETNLEGDVLFRNFVLPGAILPTDVEISWDNPQWLEGGIRYNLTDDNMIAINVGWQDWSVFSDNRLAFSGGPISPVVNLDRNWKDTWHAGIAFAHTNQERSRFSVGFSYDSSPVDDEDRTIDFPVDEIFKLSTSYSWWGAGKFDYAIGATLTLIGDGKVDQTSQGVRFAGEFDKNYLLLVGATLRRQFD